MSFGSWNEDKHKKEIELILKEKRIDYTARNLEGFLSHVLEIKIDNKNYWFVVMYGGTMLSEYVHLASLFGSEKNIHLKQKELRDEVKHHILNTGLITLIS